MRKENSEFGIHFLKQLREHIGNPPDFGEQLAKKLKISPANAYKRMNGDSYLKTHELAMLAAEYNFSIDTWMGREFQGIVHFRNSGFLRSEDDLVHYLNQTYADLSRLTSQKHKFYYAARDLPLFIYFLDDSLLRFKLAIWLDGLGRERKKDFLDLRFKDVVRKRAQSLGNLYLDFNSYEFYTERTIVNVLKQVETAVITRSITELFAIEVIEGLREVVIRLFDYVMAGKKEKGVLQMYHADYLMMTNSALIEVEDRKISFISYAGVNYLRSEDPLFGAEMKEWFGMMEDKSDLVKTKKSAQTFRASILKKIEHFEDQLNRLGDAMQLDF